MIINSLLGETRSRKARVAFCKLQSALIFHKAHNDASVLASQLPKLFQYCTDGCKFKILLHVFKLA